MYYDTFSERVTFAEFRARAISDLKSIGAILIRPHLHWMLRGLFVDLLLYCCALFIPAWWFQNDYGSMGPFLTKKSMEKFIDTYVSDAM